MVVVAFGMRAEAQPARPCSDVATELAANTGTWAGPLAATVT